MMPCQSYQLWEVERPKSAAEQRAADARRGELAAAMAGTISAACAWIRGVVQRPARDPAPPNRAPSRGRSTNASPGRPLRELADCVDPMSSGREPSLPQRGSVTG
jgi:hypothetical protein